MSEKCHKTIKLLLRKFNLIPQITHMSYGIYSAPLPGRRFKQSALCELGIRDGLCDVCARKVHVFQVVYQWSPVQLVGAGGREGGGALQTHRAEPSL